MVSRAALQAEVKSADTGSSDFEQRGAAEWANGADATIKKTAQDKRFMIFSFDNAPGLYKIICPSAGDSARGDGGVRVLVLVEHAAHGELL